MSDLPPAAREYVLTLADDEHMIGSRHTGWIGLGPFLEEDLAFCSIAQDELGHAIALYRLLVDDTEIDRFAMTRHPEEYRSSWLAEHPCHDWASALVRHWMYDRAEELRWSAVSASSVPALADLVPGVRREEAFHLRHAEQLMSHVLGADDGGEAHRRILDALYELRPIAATLWLPPFDEPAALAEGVADRSFEEMGLDWERTIEADLARWGLDPAAGRGASFDGPVDRRVRSGEFADFQRELTEVLSLDPAAVW